MVSFDRIKVVTPINVVNDINADYFNCVEKGKSQKRWIFNSGDEADLRSLDLPFKLFIKFNWSEQELVLDLPAKLLRDNYYLGINSSTIELLMNNLNDLEIVDINYSKWVNSALMLSCDPFVDIKYNYDLIKSKDVGDLRKNPSSWIVDPYSGGIEFFKAVKTRNRRLNCKLYDKHRQMQSFETSEGFLDYVDDPKSLLDRFSGKVRFELELRSFETIRRFFGISTTDDSERSLIKLLKSKHHPINKVIDEIFDLEYKPHNANFLIPVEKMNYELGKEYCVLEKHQFDLNMVYSFLKSTMSPKSKPSVTLKRYRSILAKIEEEKNESSIKDVLKLLSIIKEKTSN